MTPEEKHLWYDFLVLYPIRFQRQKAIGGYIVDFYCHQARLVVELDGIQHCEERAVVYDEKRTKVLEEHGLEVLRFLNSEITQTFDEVCEAIHNVVDARMGGVNFRF